MLYTRHSTADRSGRRHSGKARATVGAASLAFDNEDFEQVWRWPGAEALADHKGLPARLLLLGRFCRSSQRAVGQFRGVGFHRVYLITLETSEFGPAGDRHRDQSSITLRAAGYVHVNTPRSRASERRWNNSV